MSVFAMTSDMRENDSLVAEINTKTWWQFFLPPFYERMNYAN
jgi:hypothetical protein